MKILVDMNLSPEWVAVLADHGHEAVHWSTIGDARASDNEIMAWAASHGHAVFTHDLDFSSILAATQAAGPSVIQIRTQDVLPDVAGRPVADALHAHAQAIAAGAIVVVEPGRARVRVLPLP